MTKTNSRNKGSKKLTKVLIALAIIVVAAGIFITVFTVGIAPKANATTTPLTEEAYIAGKEVDPDANSMYSAYIADLSRYAVKKQTNEYISDGYVKAENSTFTYYYQTANGYFSVPAVGDTDKIVNMLYSDKGDVTDYIDISFNGECLDVKVTPLA